MLVMDEGTRPDAGAWRERLLLTLTHWSAVFGGVIAIGVTIRALASGFVDLSNPAFRSCSSATVQLSRCDSCQRSHTVCGQSGCLAVSRRCE